MYTCIKTTVFVLLQDLTFAVRIDGLHLKLHLRHIKRNKLAYTVSFV